MVNINSEIFKNDNLLILMNKPTSIPHEYTFDDILLLWHGLLLLVYDTLKYFIQLGLLGENSQKLKSQSILKTINFDQRNFFKLITSTESNKIFNFFIIISFKS